MWKLNSLSLKAMVIGWQWEKAQMVACDHSQAVKSTGGQWEWIQLGLAWNHSQTDKPIRSKQQWGTQQDWQGITHILSSQQDQNGSDSEEHSWTWHEITHKLSSPQDHSDSQDNEKGHSWTWHEITYSLPNQQTVRSSEDKCICCEITHFLLIQQ